MDMRTKVRGLLVLDYGVEPETADLLLHRFISMGGTWEDGNAKELAEDIYSDSRYWSSSDG